MSFYSDIKMDWNELVKKTTTGITSAREYQLLWRHLSYRHPLLLPVEHCAIDDDSDIECELEASPQVSLEAYVRVMAASYVPSECDPLEDTTSEAPLTINIPYTRLPEGSSSGMNITFPVRLQKVSSPEMMNGNGSASSQKKRKRWSAKEDEELLAALKRCGQGNWTRIAQGEFNGKRTASQLSQRWLYIRRRCGVSTSASQSSQQQIETLAANHALSLALDNSPPSKKVSMFRQGLHLVPSKKRRTNKGSSSQDQQQSKPIVLALARAAKSRVGVRRTTARSTSRLSLMVTANSAAAAACMGGVSPLCRTIPVAHTAVLGSTNQNLVDRTAVPSISGAGSQYNIKCEANNKVGSMLKVSNVCREPAEFATVGGTGQGV